MNGCKLWQAQSCVQGASDEAAAAAVGPSPDDPQPLTEEEVGERDALLGGGFSAWSRRDFNAFVRACEKVQPWAEA